MYPSDSFKRYTEQVCAQIRWKKARAGVAEEIAQHLTDQRDAYLAAGDDEAAAEEKAILQMGDPIAVGAALDYTHRPASQRGMIALLLAMCFLGLLLQYCLSTSFPAAVAGSGSLPYLLTMGMLGTAVFLGAYFLDFSLIGRHPYALLLILLAAALYLLCFATQTYGSQKWLVFGGFSVGAAALSLLFPLGFCGMLYRLRRWGRMGYLCGGILAAFCCVLLAMVSTAGSVFVFLCAAGVLMVIASKRGWFGEDTSVPLIIFLAEGSAFIVFFCMSGHRLARLLAAIFPLNDPQGMGYVPSVLQSMLKNAVLFGQGVSLPAALPDMLPVEGSFLSDYLLTSLAYRYGWAAALLPVVLLVIFLGIGLKKCCAQRSVLGQMAALSILCTFAAEILLYIITNLGFTVIAPIALPFFSYGSAALMIHMALAGMLLSVFRNGACYRDGKPAVRRMLSWLHLDEEDEIG